MRTKSHGAGNLPYEKERRRHPRYAVEDLPVLVGGTEQELRVRDLSRSGACFFAEAPIRVMTHVRFHFALPGDPEAQAISGEGVVVRCERISPAIGHYEVALFFQDIGADDRKRLEAYLGGLEGRAGA